jgi:hypothetical protein
MAKQLKMEVMFIVVALELVAEYRVITQILC